MCCWSSSSSLKTFFAGSQQLEVWVVMSCGSTLNSATPRNPKLRRDIALWYTHSDHRLLVVNVRAKGLQRTLFCGACSDWAQDCGGSRVQREVVGEWWDSLTGTTGLCRRSEFRWCILSRRPQSSCIFVCLRLLRSVTIRSTRRPVTERAPVTETTTLQCRWGGQLM